MAITKQRKSQQKIIEEQKRQEKLKEKMEIQRKKMDFGETWRQGLSKAKQKELDKIIGDSKTPKVIDSIDLNNFFEPINFYKNNKDERLDLDYKKYLESEEAYKDALEMIDKELAGEDLDQDKNLDINEVVAESVKEEKKKEDLNKINGLKIPKFLQMDYQEWSKYFQRFVPLYNKHICSCCGQILDYDYFFPQYIETNLARIEPTGKMHSHVCINCSKKIYEYLYFEKAEKDPVEAMKWYCSYMNIYFSEVTYYKAKKNMEKNKNKNHILYEYMQIINRETKIKDKCFLESDLSFGEKESKKTGNEEEQENNENNNSGNNNPENSVDEWSKEDLKNRKMVIKMVGYDVFDYETDENRKMLYRDLLGILEQGMEMDQVKLQAAIQIVISFLRVRELNRIYRQKERAGASVNELKGLSELKAKEMKTITDFSKDNGFSERYATAKAKGENSFTGIMNKMDEQKYEDALVNRYDIQTSDTIQQAADASFKAIMNQLSLGEAEVWQTCQKQLKVIEELRRENEKITEELRKAKYKIAQEKLQEEAKKKGYIDDDDLDDGFEGF